MNWSDERVELLKKLWSEGLSASQIASQLGGVSRNAVIGKVHRLKLAGRGRSTAAAPRQKKAAPPAAARVTQRTRAIAQTVGATALQVQFDVEPVARQIVRPSENVVIPISRNLKLIELTERTCKWPNGDPLSDEFSFCGSEAGDASPYCAYHGRVAYQPVSERRRPR